MAPSLLLPGECGAQIYVSDSPYFAKTDSAGRALLADLPAGRYRVRVWHPRTEGAEQATVKSIEVTADTDADVGWELAHQAAVPAARAPLPGDPGYR